MSPSLVLLWLERTGLVGDSLAITVCRLGGREGDVPPAGREDGGRGEEGRSATRHPTHPPRHTPPSHLLFTLTIDQISIEGEDAGNLGELVRQVSQASNKATLDHPNLSKAFNMLTSLPHIKFNMKQPTPL